MAMKGFKDRPSEPVSRHGVVNVRSAIRKDVSADHVPVINAHDLSVAIQGGTQVPDGSFL